MPTKNLAYDINLDDKAAAEFERIDSSFLILCIKCYQPAFHATGKLSMIGRCGSATAIPNFNSHYPNQLAAANIGARPIPPTKDISSIFRCRLVVFFFFKQLSIFKVGYVNLFSDMMILHTDHVMDYSLA